MAREATDRRAKILLAALECSKGDLDATFTAEELLVQAWKTNPMDFGLRGFEREYPASEIIHREIGKRGPGTRSMVEMGLLDQVDRRVYRLTVSGLQEASKLVHEDSATQEKVTRELESGLSELLGHRVFQAWLQDASRPSSFREAGQFWGIAPGTPPRVIRDRIRAVDDLLASASAELDRRGVGEMADKRGRILFNRDDLRRSQQFQEELKKRFSADLELLGVVLLDGEE